MTKLRDTSLRGCWGVKRLLEHFTTQISSQCAEKVKREKFSNLKSYNPSSPLYGYVPPVIITDFPKQPDLK